MNDSVITWDHQETQLTYLLVGLHGNEEFVKTLPKYPSPAELEQVKAKIQEAAGPKKKLEFRLECRTMHRHRRSI